MSRKNVNGSFSLVYKGIPLSYNCKDARKKSAYKARLSSAFKRKYSGSIPEGDLFAIVYYFYKEDVMLDADNISKPVWDSLSEVAYSDDRQIKIRSAVAIDLGKLNIMDFDQDNLSTEDVYDLSEGILDSDHTLYIQVGRIEDYGKIFNQHLLWQ